MPNQPYAFGCLMVDLNIPGWAALGDRIPQAELYEPDQPRFGRQPEPHCTVLFGFHDTPGLGPELLEKLPLNLPALLGSGGLIGTGCDVFTQPDYDVVKLSLRSPELTRLNAWCRARYAYTSNFPEYLPHVTLAYVLPGYGQKYKTGSHLHLPLRPYQLTYSVAGDGTEKIHKLL
jgi:hypothetical protein